MQAADGSWTDSNKTANDPCPTGYRVPTKAQWDGLIGNNMITDLGIPWIGITTNYSTGKKIGDRLFLPAAGYRYGSSTGKLFERGYNGNYWGSSKDSSIKAWQLYFDSGIINTGSGDRVFGLSIRCIAE